MQAQGHEALTVMLAWVPPGIVVDLREELMQGSCDPPPIFLTFPTSLVSVPYSDPCRSRQASRYAHACACDQALRVPLRPLVHRSLREEGSAAAMSGGAQPLRWLAALSLNHNGDKRCSR